MSLLIPTENDYADAHGDVEGTLEYAKRIAECQGDRNAENKLLYPWKFEAVKGFFKQTDEATDDLKFRYTEENFGRLKSWDEITAALEKLNAEAADNESYKLVFFARHGQGYHNVIVEKYGLKAWQEKWHNQTTDGEIVYAPDPMLTELGINQAKENNAAWKQEVQLGAPIPQSFYVSPLQRSSWTCVLTWEGITEPRPLVTEAIRETLNVNLCDKRSSKLVIELRFQKYGFRIEDGFSEEDTLFKDHDRETLAQQALRVNGFLQKLFDNEWNGTKVDRTRAHENTVISTTSHAGTIRAFITVLGHRMFTISTGGMIPVVVKATRQAD